MVELIDQFFNDTIPEETKINDDIIIGIDLGTCNSCCSIWRNNSAEIIVDEYGNRTIPSIVVFSSKNEMIVGHDAQNKMLLSSKNAFYEIKRLIGRKMTDQTVIGDQKFLMYQLCGDKDGNVNIIRQKDETNIMITPEELSAGVLMKLKEMASEYLKTPITKAVIAVPAYFNDAQRQATRDAAEIAGLNCVRIISEPIASALAYGLNKMSKIKKDSAYHVIVYDLGGGTLDVSLLTICDGIFEVEGTAGNTHLGGVDFDNRLFDYCLNNFKLMHDDFNVNDVFPDMLQKLHKVCESAKKVLSTSAQTIIGVTNFWNAKNLMIHMTRNKFNEICNDLLVMCLQPLVDILRSCDIKKEDINEAILVGGMTRVPSIRENIYRFFEKCPNSSINPDEIVSIGAAIQGYIISHKSDPFSESVTLLDTTPLSLGVETIGGVMNIMIPRNTLIPVSEKQIFSNDTPNETSILIKVFEGERKMTNDNFCVGEFELSGLAPSPRGYHNIEVTFTVDVDGMITVSAEDLHKNNMSTIRINGNRGRLSKDSIEKMVNEAKEYEKNDKLRKKRKKMHYELTELCDNIEKNLYFTECQLPESEKDNIRIEVSHIRIMLKKDFDEITEEFYKEQLHKIKRNYCVLITKINDDSASILKSCAPNSDEIGTSVFQNDNDDDKTYVKVIATELGYDDSIDNVKLNELKQIRDTLTDMCHSVSDIVNNPNVFIDETMRQDIKNFVEDLIVWIHVQPKISFEEYQSKLNELTHKCNDCIKEERSDCENEEELMTLCLSIKSSIVSNPLSINEKMTRVLNDEIDNILLWMNENKNAAREQYSDKISYINGICNKIYEEIVNTKK
jgi:L1 cell adhesion molecule like protein